MTDFWHLRIYVHNSKTDNHCGRGGAPLIELKNTPH
uniref:Uncharacterized protein n=1 Tax=virus sp. ctLTC15 TaxID=2826801 RepID=A0A8S5R8H5_9VIRU|nr:MAG TPA: hypothetical protein [virus sp. ctLTC15]